jgi:hypothetical protein
MMVTSELIRAIHLYYAQFVAPEVRLAPAVKTVRQLPGYTELKAELAALPSGRVVPDFDAYVCSASEEYVSAKVKISKNLVLFVEYGAIGITENDKGIRSVDAELAVTVAGALSPADTDMLEQTLMMSRTLDVLLHLVACMEADSEDLNACPLMQHIAFPCTISPVQPKDFFDHQGWVAIFKTMRYEA